MQISSKRLAIEAATGTAVVLAAVVVGTRAPHLGLGVLHPHPVWLVVLALAARYGARGLVTAVPIAWGSLALLAGPWHATSAGVLATLATPAELGTLAAAVIVGWIASMHERHVRVLEEKMKTLGERATRDAAALGELRRAAMALRARNDRLDLSLTFLRDVSRRMSSGDLGAASDAALTLAMARLGARAAAVEIASDVGDTENGRNLAPVATAGAWPTGAAAPPDATTAETLRTGQPARAVDLSGAGPDDSDLAAPIVVGGVTVGVLAVRGISRAGAATLRDLTVIAEWLAPSFGCAARAGADDQSLPALETARTRDSASRPITTLHLAP